MQKIPLENLMNSLITLTRVSHAQMISLFFFLSLVAANGVIENEDIIAAMLFATCLWKVRVICFMVTGTIHGSLTCILVSQLLHSR